MNIVVTGATGFLGFSLTRALARDGHRVTGLARTAEGRDCALRAGLAQAGVTVTVAPLETPVKLPAGTECVVHAAGMRDRPGLTWLDAMEANLGGTLSALRQASAAGVRRFVYVSSQSVYGREGAPWSEEAPTAPSGAYGQSKAAGEVASRAWADAFEVHVARLSRLYGANPCVRWTELPGRIATAVVEGSPIDIHGRGEQRLDLLHVEDAARGVARLATGERIPAGTFNFGSGGSVSLNELVETAEELAVQRGLPRPDIHRLPEDPRGGFVHLELRTSKADRLLDWRACVPLPQGLGELIDARRALGPGKRVD